MNRLLFVAGALLLTSCAPPIWIETAPGRALPTGIAVCNKRDVLARCTEWSSQSDACVNPNGPYVANPLVMCSDMKTPVRNPNE